jgi:hypothetical protein
MTALRLDLGEMRLEMTTDTDLQFDVLRAK